MPSSLCWHCFVNSGFYQASSFPPILAHCFRGRVYIWPGCTYLAWFPQFVARALPVIWRHFNFCPRCLGVEGGIGGVVKVRRAKTGLLLRVCQQRPRMEWGESEYVRNSFWSGLKLDLIGETLRHLTVLYKCKLEIALGLRHLGKNKWSTEMSKLCKSWSCLPSHKHMTSAKAFPVKTPMEPAASILCIYYFINSILHSI